MVHILCSLVVIQLMYYYILYIKQKHVVLLLQQKLEFIDKLEKGQSAKSLTSDYNVGKQTVRD